MMRSESRTGSGRALAVGSAFLCSAALAGPALETSDESPDDPGAGRSVAEVVVTGSNVRDAALNSVVDIQVLDQAQLQQSGARQVSDLINDIPASSGTQLYNETGQLTGTAQFELRGLGFSSTLTLLNGRRAGVAPLSDKSGADFVDINQFPLLMVDHIDVLKNGSSAIYGSEAVAGVVNIITRKSYNGLELAADYASSTNNAYSLSLAAGHTFDRGSLSLFATYYGQTGNVRSDFDWLIARIAGNGIPGRSQLLSSNGYPGTYTLAGTSAAGKPVVVPGATAVSDPNCQAAGGVFPINNNGTVNTSTCNFNFVDQIGVIPDENRLQMFAQGDYELTDHVQYFNETSFSRNVNYIYKQPGGFSNGPAGGQIYVPASAPFNFFVADPTNSRNIIYVDPSQWNPAVDHAVAVAGNYRPQGQYFSGQKQQTDTYVRAVNGLDVSLAHDWHLTASHEYAYAEFAENDPVRFNATALNALIASGQYNPFGTSIVDPTLVSPKDGVSVAANPQSVINQIFYTANTTRRTEQQVVDLAISGPVVELPTGTVSVAVGGQHREQTLKYSPDSLSAEGLSDSAATDAPFSGSEHVTAAYAEVLMPFNELGELQAAVRHEDYGGSIGSTTNPKVAGRINVIPGKLAIRASWGTSFQAPTLTQGATSQAFAIVNDPVVLGANGFSCSNTSTGNNVNVITSGGGLKPQTSHNYDFGVAATPVDALNLTADFWHYNYSNLIAAGQNGQAIVNGECVNGVFVSDPRAVRGAGGQLFSVNTAYVNVGKVVTDGIDIAATYHVSAGYLGDFAVRGDATHVNSFDVYSANGTVQQDAGSRNFNNNFAPMPKWRGVARGVWSKSIHEASAAAHYTAGYKNDQSGNAPVSSFTTLDLQYRLHIDGLITKDTSEVRIGVNNVFDKAPPSLIRYNAAGQLISGTVSDVDRPGYDPLSGANIQGRILYVHFSQKF